MFYTLEELLFFRLFTVNNTPSIGLTSAKLCQVHVPRKTTHFNLYTPISCRFWTINYIQSTRQPEIQTRERTDRQTCSIVFRCLSTCSHCQYFTVMHIRMIYVIVFNSCKQLNNCVRIIRTYAYMYVICVLCRECSLKDHLLVDQSSLWFFTNQRSSNCQRY